jgi:hypothetical protein
LVKLTRVFVIIIIIIGLVHKRVGVGGYALRHAFQQASLHSLRHLP